MSAKLVTVAGAVGTLSGIAGLVMSCPKNVPVSQGWDYVPFDLTYPVGYHFQEAMSWGPWSLCCLIASVAGIIALAVGASWMHRQLTLIIGILASIVGFQVLRWTHPYVEKVAHLRGHAIVDELDHATLTSISRTLSAFYASEIVLLTGLLFVAVGFAFAVARQVQRRTAT